MTTYSPFEIYAHRAAAIRLDELVAGWLPTQESYSGDCRYVEYQLLLIDGSMGWSYQGCDHTICLIGDLTGLWLDSFMSSEVAVLQRRDFVIDQLREHVLPR